MKIDLCKLLGVEEGEEFKVDAYVNWFSNFKYKIRDNALLHSKLRENDFTVCSLSLNELKYIKEIIRLPKKKQFKDDELCILRNIDKEYKWIARDKVDKDEYDKYGNLNIYFGKPKKSTKSWLPSDVYCEFHGYNHLLQSIKWEDEEPIYIDDYVER